MKKVAAVAVNHSMSRQDYFAVLDEPYILEANPDDLERRYLEKQRTFHPDRFVGRDEAEKKNALSEASFVNEAYQVLKSPIKRAHALINHNYPLQESGSVQATEFLMQIMELQESLEEATKPDRISLIKAELEGLWKNYWQDLKDAVANESWAEAAAQYYCLKYIDGMVSKTKAKRI
jgi:molecular chaperone HscB